MPFELGLKGARIVYGVGKVHLKSHWLIRRGLSHQLDYLLGFLSGIALQEVEFDG